MDWWELIFYSVGLILGNLAYETGSSKTQNTIWSVVIVVVLMVGNFLLFK